jgi:endonuclease/exonuclease/phosphatase family metal-dependent hydrolase
LIGTLVFILSLLFFLAWASYPWSLRQREVSGEILHFDPEVMVNNLENPSVIKVMSWNLGFLYGEGSEGDNYEHQDQDYFIRKLNSLIKEIEIIDPDVLFLQEIDFDSARSSHINQAEIMAKKAGYPYVAKAISWESNYIPFPYWPPKNHFGKMKSGGAILSKYPITSNSVHLLSKPGQQPWWYNLFYLHRYLQEVEIDFGDKRLRLINVHLEAFDKVNRSEQIQKLKQLIQSGPVALVAGDFNMVPSVAIKKSKFKNNDDYENDPSFDLMTQSGLSEVISTDLYSQDEARYFTYPSSAPDRRLDYIYFSSTLKLIKAEVIPSSVSDHLPIMGIIQISKPKFSEFE